MKTIVLDPYSNILFEYDGIFTMSKGDCVTKSGIEYMVNFCVLEIDDEDAGDNMYIYTVKTL